MKPFLFLLGSIGGFLALSQRYRGRSKRLAKDAEEKFAAPSVSDVALMAQKGAAQWAIQDWRVSQSVPGTPVNIGDGSMFVEAPCIDDTGVWGRTENVVRSPEPWFQLINAELRVNGTPIPTPTVGPDAFIVVYYDESASLAVSAPESDTRRLNLVWTDSYGSGFLHGAHGRSWMAGGGKLHFKGPDNTRITRIEVDGILWYRATSWDTAGQQARCLLRLYYHHPPALVPPAHA